MWFSFSLFHRALAAVEITEETEETVARSVNVEAEATLGVDAPFLAKFLVKVLAQIQGSVTDKRRIRQLLTPEVSRLKTDINLLLADGSKKVREKFPEKKGILLILSKNKFGTSLGRSSRSMSINGG